jgi:membrane protein
MTWRSVIDSGRRVIGDTFSVWSRSDCTTQAAAVSFYAALSLFPFVIVLISGVGLFFEVFESGQNAEQTVLQLLSEVFSAEMSASVANILKDVQGQARVTGPVASVVLLYLGSRMFTQIDTAFEHIWDVKGRKRGFRGSVKDWVITRLRSVAMIGGFGAVGLFVFFGGTVLYTAEEFLNTWFPQAESFWGLRSYLLSLATNTLVFGGVYRVLSKGPVQWKLCFGTGLAVAGVWEIGRVVIASLVIGEKYTALGVAGSFLGILLWIFYNILALLLGAVFVKVMAKRAAPIGEIDQGAHSADQVKCESSAAKHS